MAPRGPQEALRPRPPPPLRPAPARPAAPGLTPLRRPAPGSSRPRWRRARPLPASGGGRGGRRRGEDFLSEAALVLFLPYFSIDFDFQFLLPSGWPPLSLLSSSQTESQNLRNTQGWKRLMRSSSHTAHQTNPHLSHPPDPPPPSQPSSGCSSICYVLLMSCPLHRGTPAPLNLLPDPRAIPSYDDHRLVFGICCSQVPISASFKLSASAPSCSNEFCSSIRHHEDSLGISCLPNPS